MAQKKIPEEEIPEMVTRGGKEREEVFRYLYQEYRNDFLQFFGGKYDISRSDLKDLFQDAKIELYRKAKSNQIGKSKIGGFINLTIKNKIRNFTRKKKGHSILLSNYLDKTEYDKINNEAEEKIETQTYFDLLKKGLGKTCFIIVSHSFNGYNSTEILQKLQNGWSQDKYYRERKKCEKKVRDLLKALNP